MTSREDSVLAARDPSLHDENDWEEFSLSEVRILVPRKSRYANLLAASADNPVQVTGCLDEVEEEQEGLGEYTFTPLVEREGQRWGAKGITKRIGYAKGKENWS